MATVGSKQFRIRATRLLLDIESFLAWWFETLGEHFSSWRGLLGRDTGQRTIIACREGNVLVIRARDGAKTLAEIPLGAAAPQVARAAVRRRPVELVLPPDAFITGQVAFPAAAVSRAADAIELLLPRLCPLPRQDIVLSVVAREQGADETATVSYAIARRAVIEELKGTLAADGYTLRRITAEGGTEERRLRFRFALGDDATWRLPRHPLWGAIALGLACALVLAGGWLRTNIVTDRTEALAAARTETRDANRLASELGELRETAAMLERARARPTNAAVLTELAERLADDTFLTKVEIAGTRLRVTGLSQSAARALAQLSASALFRDVRFTTPVLLDPGLSRERFDLEAEIRAGKPP